MTDGIILGRFQPFHLGHLEFAVEAKARCDRLYIGITNPDVENRQFSEYDPSRSKPENNPLGYFDRARMIEDTVRDIGWQIDDFMVVPAPIGDTERLLGYLPPPDQTIFLATIYDKWGEEKIRRLEGLGYKSEVMWTRTYDERFTTGTEVRQLIRGGAAWEHLVPAPVAAYIKKQCISL